MDNRFGQMMFKPETPKVGVGVIVLNYHSHVLLMLRKGSHGAGFWALPGGHLELGESIYECCERELSEETGVILEKVEKLTFSNNVMESEGLHYVTLFMAATEWEGEPEIMEPDKCAGMGWFALDKLPDNLFGPLAAILPEIRRWK